MIFILMKREISKRLLHEKLVLKIWTEKSVLFYCFSSQLGEKVNKTSKDLTYYVSPTGSDTTGDGSQSKPFATIQHANLSNRSRWRSN